MYWNRTWCTKKFDIDIGIDTGRWGLGFCWIRGVMFDMQIILPLITIHHQNWRQREENFEEE